jgi:hypothetical protein
MDKNKAKKEAQVIKKNCPTLSPLEASSIRP